jgi:hypothetical protein
MDVLPPIEDEFMIRRTLERYMRHDDDRSLTKMLTLFHDDAIYRVAGEIFVGIDAIRDFFIRVGYTDKPGSWTDPGALMTPPTSVHVLSNPVIDVDGDLATVETDFVVMDRDEAGHGQLILLGRYRDVLRRHSERGWLFAERTGVSMARRTAV